MLIINDYKNYIFIEFSKYYKINNIIIINIFIYLFYIF